MKTHLVGMPELPEVEAARRALHDNCCGRVILEVSVADDPIVIDGVASSALQKALTGRTIVGALRKGKNLWLQLDGRPWPSFQFGMTGAFYIKGKEITKYKRSAVSDKEEWPSKFSKVFLKLDDGLEVSFTDKRRLARVRLLEDPAIAPPISELGPDAFLELPVEATFTSSILKKKCPIKALLLDQSFLAGIGNWIADEVLYQARIHPEQVASSLSEADCIKLHKSIQEVIKFSVEVDADSERFPETWIFHHRWNKKPGELGGKKIAFITVGGRTSAYVPALQKCTVQSSRKQNGTTRKQAREKVENDTSDIKKKRGRKNHVSVSVETEDLDDKQDRKKSERSAKRSTSTNKAELKEGGEGKKIQRKAGVVAEIKEGKTGVSDKQKTVKSSMVRTQDIKRLVSAKSGKKRRRPVAKQQIVEEKTEEVADISTETIIVQDDRVDNKASSKKSTRKIKKDSRTDMLDMSADTPKKTQGQKRKRDLK